MASSTIKRRQEAERQRSEAYEQTLRRVFRAPRPAPDLETAISEARGDFATDVVRPSHSWLPKLKTRDPGRLRLAAARHLFARYPVPAHLEAIWLVAAGLDAEEVHLRKSWYVAAAGGRSLYKAGASQWLSRREVHAFLSVRADLRFEQAFWLAIVRGMTDDQALALRIARTRIATAPRDELGFWREVARFFCAHPTSREEIDDLCDFIVSARERNGDFSLSGRTLASLRRLSAEWHHDVAAVARIAAMVRRVAGRQALQARWDGSLLQNWRWQPAGKDARARGEFFEVVQLTRAEELVAESRAMQHCVWTYANKCIAGHASIWSLRRIDGKCVLRLLTIELDREHRAVQVRGYANRLASADEAKVLARWAQAKGVTL